MLPRPDIDSWFLFAVQVFLALYAIIAIHELGHWLAGKLAGLRIASCGIGVGKPYFSFRALGTSFYLARQRRVGLTVFLADNLAPQRGRMAAFIVGGVAANLLTAAAILFLWHQGWTNNFLVILFYWSLWGSVNLVPYQVRLKNGVSFRTDGMVLLKLLSGRAPFVHELATTYLTSKSLRELSQRIDAYDAVIHWSLQAAQTATALGLFEEAEKYLADPSLIDPRRGNLADWLEAIARVSYAVARHPDSAGAMIDEAERTCAGRPDVLAALAVSRAGLAIERQEPAQEYIAEARRRIEAAELVVFRDTVDVLEFLAEPPVDLVSACRALVDRRGSNELNAYLKLSVLSHAVKVLMERGEQSAARPFFAEANRYAVETVRMLSSEERSRALPFLTRPLREAISHREIEEPLWIPVEGARGSTRETLKVELSLGLVCMAVAAVCLYISVNGFRNHRLGTADSFGLPGAIFALWGICCGIWTLVRGRLPRLYPALLMLACASLFFTSASLHRVVQREQRRLREALESKEAVPVEPHESPVEDFQ